MTPQQNSQYETLGAAAAGIVHDLNNQFTLIVNHLAGRDIAGALAIVRQCTALTASVLDVTRGDVLKLGPVDPAHLVREFAAKLRLPLGVRLFVNIPSPVAPVLADPAAVIRALTNLALNACQAMDAGGVLRLSVLPGIIEVADSGNGIDSELAERVFEPFFTTRGELGNGLGLTIVRDIMRRHSGSVTLRCEEGRGAAFTLRFRPAAQKTQGRILKGSPRKIAPAA